MIGRRRVQEVVILVIGVSTPIGILAVNASAFITQHLQQFRLAIGVCALASGLCLNGLGAYAALGRAYAYAPRLYAEYRTWAVGIAVVVVGAWSVIGAWLTYVSMQDPRQLPNLAAVLTAIWLLLLPFLMTFAARRFKLLDRQPGMFGAERSRTPPGPPAAPQPRVPPEP
jgi:hypothetical protein